MPTKVKVQAKDVSSAIAKGLKDLGLRRDQVEVTVLEHPKKGFLGFGSKPALVEIRQKRWSASELDAQIYMDVPRKKRGGRGRNGGKRRERDSYNSSDRRDNRRRNRKFDRGSQAEMREKAPKANEPQLLPCERIQNAVIPENLKAPMQEAKQYLNDILTHMGVTAENLNVWWDEQQQRILLTFDCDHPAIVIGKEGKTLEAIQYLCTLSLSRHFDKPISVITDTQNYWRKAEDKINAEIERGIAFIEAGNSIYRFRPMSAQLRRYIHRALEGHATVATSSEGEGKWRKVTLRRKTQEEAAQAAVQAAPAAAVQEALHEAQEEKDLQAYAESSSCCCGEEEHSCSCGDCCCEHPQEAQPTCSCEQAPVQETVTVETVTVQETVVTTAVAEEPAPVQEPVAATAETQEQVQSAAQAAAPVQEEQKPAPANTQADCCGPLFAAAQENDPQAK